MFIGHYAVALIAAARPRTPRLGTLFVATQLIDIVFFGFALVGIEHLRAVPGIAGSNSMDLYDMPWTHSLLGSCGWAIGFALVLRALGARWRAAMVGAAVVVSHWFLDLLVHIPDLTLAGLPPRLGLGLWRMPTIEHPLEIVLAIGSLGYFAWATRTAGRRGIVALAVLGAAMLGLQAIDWGTPAPPTIVDPVPSSQPLIALLAYAILAGLAWWVDRRRTGS